MENKIMISFQRESLFKSSFFLLKKIMIIFLREKHYLN